MEYYHNDRLAPELEEAAAKVQQEVAAAFEEAERELELMRQEGEAEEMAAYRGGLGKLDSGIDGGSVRLWPKMA
jgi:hypothetical protein